MRPCMNPPLPSDKDKKECPGEHQSVICIQLKDLAEEHIRMFHI